MGRDPAGLGSQGILPATIRWVGATQGNDGGYLVRREPVQVDMNLTARPDGRFVGTLQTRARIGG